MLVLVGAAVSTETARWCAEWADGLITVNAPVEQLQKMVDAYRDAGGRGKLHLQVQLSWAPEEDPRWRSRMTSGDPTCSVRRCAGT
jgi:alkanesulfonate monooxygenase SsuD/methylene tetrahydromethanopterin reductase-like flavin-dependent oxidoreductase (luciferase family)